MISMVFYFLLAMKADHCLTKAFRLAIGMIRRVAALHLRWLLSTRCIHPIGVFVASVLMSGLSTGLLGSQQTVSVPGTPQCDPGTYPGLQEINDQGNLRATIGIILGGSSNLGGFGVKAFNVFPAYDGSWMA